MQLKTFLSFLFITVLFMVSCNQSNEQQDALKFESTWESLAKAEPADWWTEGKFGIFIHWGPYSVAGYRYQHKGYAEAITNDMYKRPEQYKPFFMEKFAAAPPDFGYKDWVNLYTAGNWGPEAWAHLFK